MSSAIPLTNLRPLSENTYPTPEGNVTVYPRLAKNELGFILELRTPPSERPRTPSITIARIWTLLTGFLINLITLCSGKPATPSQIFRQIVPQILRNHLIVVTPPPESIFPNLYPLTDHVRVWFSHNTTI